MLISTVKKQWKNKDQISPNTTATSLCPLHTPKAYTFKVELCCFPFTSSALFQISIWYNYSTITVLYEFTIGKKTQNKENSNNENFSKVDFLASYPVRIPLFLSRYHSLYLITVRVVFKIICNFAIFIFPNCIYPELFENIFLKLYYFYMYGCFVYMYVYHVHALFTEEKKRMPGQMAVNGHVALGIKLMSSGRAARDSTAELSFQPH